MACRRTTQFLEEENVYNWPLYIVLSSSYRITQRIRTIYEHRYDRSNKMTVYEKETLLIHLLRPY